MDNRTQKENEQIMNSVQPDSSFMYGSGIWTESNESHSKTKISFDELLKQIPKLYAWKKADVFNDPKEAPVWLADEFNIMWIKYSEHIPEGYQLVTPYKEMCFIRLLATTEDEKEMHDEVILWKHKDRGDDVLDIDLTGRPLLSNFIPE